VQDPTRRQSPGSWPRDRPVRWRAGGRYLVLFLARTAAFLGQFALVIPVIALSADTGGGWVRTAVALVWGAGTLWAGWCWMIGSSRGLVAPVVTFVAIWLARSMG
jgi:hypothetical protein